MNIPSEQELILKAKDGDSEAFENLIKLSTPQSKNFIKNQYNLSDFDANDIIQNASIKAWDRIIAFRSEAGFTTWFCAIARHEAMNFIKKRNFIGQHELLSSQLSQLNETDDNLEFQEPIDKELAETAYMIIDKRETLNLYKQIIQDVLAKLPKKHSQIINLALKEEKSYKEIAEELQIPIGTVMTRIYWAKRKAKTLINQYAKRNDLQFDCVGKY